MDKIYDNQLSQLTANFNKTYKSISIEQAAMLSGNKTFNTGRILLSLDELKALIRFAEKKGLI